MEGRWDDPHLFYAPAAIGRVISNSMVGRSSSRVSAIGTGNQQVRQFSPHLHSSLSRRRLLRLVCWKMVQDPTVFGWVNAFRRVGRSSPQLGISFKRLSYLQPGGWRRTLNSSLYSASKASRWDEPHLTHTPASRLRYVQLDGWTP